MQCNQTSPILDYVSCAVLYFNSDWYLLLQEADFYMYSLYSKNKPKSDDVMAECGSLYFAVSLCIIVFMWHSVQTYAWALIIWPVVFAFRPGLAWFIFFRLKIPTG